MFRTCFRQQQHELIDAQTGEYVDLANILLTDMGQYPQRLNPSLVPIRLIEAADDSRLTSMVSIMPSMVYSMDLAMLSEFAAVRISACYRRCIEVACAVTMSSRVATTSQARGRGDFSERTIMLVFAAKPQINHENRITGGLRLKQKRSRQ